MGQRRSKTPDFIETFYQIARRALYQRRSMSEKNPFGRIAKIREIVGLLRPLVTTECLKTQNREGEAPAEPL
jgi:hypothetical protein